MIIKSEEVRSCSLVVLDALSTDITEMKQDERNYTNQRNKIEKDLNNRLLTKDWVEEICRPLQEESSRLNLHISRLKVNRRRLISAHSVLISYRYKEVRK